jgi:hypothetical protein
MALWFKADGWEGLWFKRVPEGWIFQSPTFWPFGLGPRQHYLVNESQKAEIAAAFGRMDWRILAGLGAAMLPGIILLIVFGMRPFVWNDPLLNMLLGAFLAGLWTQAVLSVFYWLALRSTLAEARPTRERITFTDRLNALAAMTPMATLILGCLLFITLCAFSAYELWKTWTVGSLLGMVFMGLITLYVCAMLTAKLRAKQPAS